MTRHVALASLLALVAAGCTESTGPTDEPERGVLFLSTRDGATDQLGRPLKDIYRMNADGSGVENLTRQPSQYLHLSLSPDGRRVAFASDRSGCDIWSVSTDGTGLVRLTNRNAADGDGCNAWPRWSPDGSRFAFVSNREMRSIGATGGLYDVYVMDADGGNAQNVSQLLGEDLLFEVAVVGWSPAGRVVFETYGPVDGTIVRRVYTVNADGTDSQPLFDRPRGTTRPRGRPMGRRSPSSASATAGADCMS